MSSLTLHNPHSALAALKTRPDDVLAVEGTSAGGPAWDEVFLMARENQVRVSKATPKAGGRKPGHKPVRSSACSATVRPRHSVDLAELFAMVGNEEDHGVWLALDQIQDPQNLGAIFRSAAFFGVKGILLTDSRSAPLSSTAYDIASGGIEFVPFSVCSNLASALKIAKERELWILGTSEHESRPLSEIERDRNWLVVLGNEEKGLRKATLDCCDLTCGIQSAPGAGVQSLNVSVAAGAILSHFSV